jgi:hypothetical protein
VDFLNLAPIETVTCIVVIISIASCEKEGIIPYSSLYNAFRKGFKKCKGMGT